MQGDELHALNLPTTDSEFAYDIDILYGPEDDRSREDAEVESGTATFYGIPPGAARVRWTLWDYTDDEDIEETEGPWIEVHIPAGKDASLQVDFTQ